MSTIQDIVTEAGEAIEALGLEVASQKGRVFLLARLGWLMPPGVNDIAIGADAVADVATKLTALTALTDQQLEDKNLVLEKVLALLKAIADFVKVLDTLVTTFANFNADYLTKTNIVAEFIPRLLDLLLFEQIEKFFPRFMTTIKALGLLQIDDFDEKPEIFQASHRRPSFHLERLGALISPDRSWPGEAYGWGTPQANIDRLLDNTSDVLEMLGALARNDLLSREAEEAIVGHPAPEADTAPAPVVSLLWQDIAVEGQGETRGLGLISLRADNPTLDNAGFGIGPIWRAANNELPLFANNGRWSLVLVAPAQEINSAFLTIRPGTVTIAAGLLGGGGSLPDGKRGLGLRFKDPNGAPTTLIDTDFGTHWEFDEAFVDFGVDTKGGSQGGFFEVGVRGGRVIVKGTEMGPFLGSIVGNQDLEASFNVGLAFSTLTGLAFMGSAGLEVDLPLHKDFGVVRIDGAKVSLSTDGGSLRLAIGANGAFLLGPVSVSVEQLGIALLVKGGRGNLGPVDLGVGFKLPTGLGIAVDAGPVSGGGFLRFEPEIGRYSGAVELSLYGVALKAFGVIETKIPGVAFSFVIVISAEFPKPIQLGFGFTLNGVGGLVGINRTVNADALQGLVTSGTAGHLLFPENVIANAPAIIRDLTTVFPARDGRYLFGPIARLGWGTPTLIRGDLGLILEIPGPVLTILGEIRALLPKPDAPLVKFNLSVGGRLDFPNKSFSLDAVLHDSVINGYPVSGQMAMRLRWGDNPSFALAIGGFHPAFQPPSNFPKALQPLTVVLAQQGSTSATVSGFFAITPNTLQVGGEARLHASGSGISLDASVSVKAIFIFSPFSFNANIDASVRISFRGYGPSVHLRGVLSGPSPWRVKGEVCVSILFWDACLGFDQSFGGKAQIAQAEINPWLGSGDIVGLKAALEDPKNWSAVQPAGSYAVVSLAPGSDSLVDPGGSFSVRQKVVPVETDSAIARLGTAKASEPGRTTPIFYKNMQPALVGVTQGGLSTLDKVLDFFAPAQYFEMNEAKKLSAPSFERKQAGYVLAGNTGSTEVGSVAFKEMKFDTVILGTGGSTSPAAEYELPDAQLSASSLRNAVAIGGFGRGGVNRFLNPTSTQPFGVQDIGFVLTRSRDLVRLNPNDIPLSRTDALIALDAHVALHPEQAGFVQIVPLHELEAA